MRSRSNLPLSFRAPFGSDVRSAGRTRLGLSLGAAMLAPLAHAQEPTQLSTITVQERAIDPNPHAEPGVPYKANTSGDARHVKPLAETPQTITVLTQQQLQDTGRSDLRDVLRAQPGITLGTGENGNAFGDRYIIRGQEARSDVFVDGLRDPGMTVRESFAVDQIEITKGPSATFAGRGATGGAVNAVTKQATLDGDFVKLSAGLGTDRYRRETLDMNRVLRDDMAIRVNLLEAYQGVPDRLPADRSRKGAAVSLYYLPTSTLEVTADYYHLEAKDKPDLGTFLQNGTPRQNIPVYVQNSDFLESKIDTWTLRLSYQATPEVKITNLSRYGTTSNGYVTTDARGNTFGSNDPNAGKPTITLSNPHQGWQEVSYFANQTNLHVDQTLWGMKHQIIFGLEYSDHKVLNGNYSISSAGQNCYTGSSATLNAWCILDGSGNTVSNVNKLINRSISKGDWDIDWQVKTTSLSAMDTVDINDKWTVFGGLRYDKFDYRNTNGTSSKTTYTLQDGLWNAHLGLTYKFRPDANVYATYSTGSDFNGGESDVTSCDYGGICVPSSVGMTAAQKQALFAQSKPEKSENLEIGTKWNVLGGKLLLTAALFQVTKSDVMEVLGTTFYSDQGAVNSGKYRVEGVELGLAGKLSPRLSVQGGLAIMNAKWLKSQTAANIGKGLSNFPEKSASLLLNYQATSAFGFGGNLTYQSEKYSGTPESPELATVKVPEYTVLDLFASYQFSPTLKARLNVGNVLNRDYYLAAYRSGTMVYLGDARNVRLTLNYDF